MVTDDELEVGGNEQNQIESIPNRFVRKGLTVNIDRSELFVSHNDLTVLNKYKYVLYFAKYEDRVPLSYLLSLDILIIVIKVDRTNWLLSTMKPYDFRQEPQQEITEHYIEIHYNVRN